MYYNYHDLRLFVMGFQNSEIIFSFSHHQERMIYES